MTGYQKKGRVAMVKNNRMRPKVNWTMMKTGKTLPLCRGKEISMSTTHARGKKEARLVKERRHKKNPQKMSLLMRGKSPEEI